MDWGRKPLLEFDLIRTARNGLIGAVFGPLVTAYYDFSDVILPPEVPINRPLKVCYAVLLQWCVVRAHDAVPTCWVQRVTQPHHACMCAVHVRF